MNAPDKESSILRGARIVVIDDSRVFTLYIKDILERQGCNVVVLNEPKFAIETIQKERPDCILSDLEMPHLSGIELCAHLKDNSQTRDIPVVILTSNDSHEKTVKAIEHGASDYLLKSSPEMVIVVKVKSCVSLARAHKQEVLTKQFEAIQNLIGRYNHEFNNAISIGRGTLKILMKENQLEENERVGKIMQIFDRIQKTTQKLSKIKSYKTEHYTSDETILSMEQSED